MKPRPPIDSSTGAPRRFIGRSRNTPWRSVLVLVVALASLGLLSPASALPPGGGPGPKPKPKATGPSSSSSTQATAGASQSSSSGPVLRPRTRGTTATSTPTASSPAVGTPSAPAAAAPAPSSATPPAPGAVRQIPIQSSQARYLRRQLETQGGTSTRNFMQQKWTRTQGEGPNTVYLLSQSMGQARGRRPRLQSPPAAYGDRAVQHTEPQHVAAQQQSRLRRSDGSEIDLRNYRRDYSTSSNQMCSGCAPLAPEFTAGGSPFNFVVPYRGGAQATNFREALERHQKRKRNDSGYGSDSASDSEGPGTQVLRIDHDRWRANIGDGDRRLRSGDTIPVVRFSGVKRRTSSNESEAGASTTTPSSSSSSPSSSSSTSSSASSSAAPATTAGSSGSVLTVPRSQEKRQRRTRSQGRNVEQDPGGSGSR